MGLAFFGPIGAFVGAALGHAVDTNMPGLFDPAAAQRTFFQALFLTMGRVAKADGRVSEREIQVARSVMLRMQLNASQKQEAIRLFNRGKKGEFDLPTTLTGLRAACGMQPQLFRLFVAILLDAGQADGPLSPAPRQLLEYCCTQLGIPVQELEQMIAGRHGGAASSADLDPYATLGVARGASEKQIKQAYRRLMSKNHPDKLISKGLPQEMLNLAKERTTQIRSAYEQIRAERGFR